LQTWIKDEATARNLLISKVSDSVALKIARSGTVAEAWTSVVSEFTEKTGYAEVDLRRDFLDSTCPAKGNVRQFLEELNTKKEKLAAVGVTISDSD
ncbi:hypothetical protein DFJ43DRAFT_961071, partial [Lentinula guzmanii]